MKDHLGGVGCLFLQMYISFSLFRSPVSKDLFKFVESNINVFSGNNNLFILHSHPTMGREKMISHHVEDIISNY